LPIRHGQVRNAHCGVPLVVDVVLTLTANRQSINAKIQRGIEELERGQGIPEDALDAELQRLKALPE
jgi:hypothetical protein